MPSEPRFGRGLLGEDRFVAAPHGRRLRTMTAGGGDDLVVLEAGLGASGLYWGPVHRELAQHVRVVAYERAGYGASAPARGTPRDLPHLAADLARVIQAHPHRRLVLVGHSWGGPIVRTYAAEHRGGESTLAGMVLVDPSDEHAADLFTSRAARWSDAVKNALFVPLARARLLAPLMKTQLAGHVGGLDAGLGDPLRRGHGPGEEARCFQHADRRRLERRAAPRRAGGRSAAPEGRAGGGPVRGRGEAAAGPGRPGTDRRVRVRRAAGHRRARPVVARRPARAHPAPAGGPT
ncbi:MAG TPA: alpha/beta hydrolase [Candidatus Brachybacterium merdigallinarum]|nr:alpha/beta hydrolase [Candidatus Brachybacterium merdigallinarum]